MKLLKPLWLILLATGSMADNSLIAQDSFCPNNNQALFQTTSWLSPATFSADRDTLLSPINDTSGTPIFLQFYAPKGGRLSNNLQAPAGYAIKKILVCSNQNRPITGVKVEVAKNRQPGAAIALPFERMSSIAPGCAIYALTTGTDGWGLPGQTLDPKVYTRLEIVLPPSKALGEIESVGVRLQAAAPHAHPLEPRQNRLRQTHLADSAWATGGEEDGHWDEAENCWSDPPPASHDEVSDVYFTEFTVDSGHAANIGKSDR